MAIVQEVSNRARTSSASRPAWKALRSQRSRPRRRAAWLPGGGPLRVAV
jgi:hypothetical protein